MAQETVINPGIYPEQPVQMELIDDQTVVFRPQFGRAWTQRNTYADPRWRVRARFRALRQWERAQLLLAMNEARGGFATVRMSPYQVRRGSFPTSELLTGSTYFANTSMFTSLSDVTLAAVDGMVHVRVTENDGTNAAAFSHSGVAITGFAPYVIRAAQLSPTNPGLIYGIYYDGFFAGPINYILPPTMGVLATAGKTANGTHVPTFVGYNTGATDGHKDGDSYVLNYASMSRCALVDAGQNLLINSDQITSSPWAATGGSTTADVATSPTGINSGTSRADRFTENTGGGAHYAGQAITVPSAAGSYTLSVALKYDNAQWAFIELTSTAYTYVDLINGTLGNNGGGNQRAAIEPLGNGWYRVSASGLKPAGTTSITAAIGTASSNGVNSFTGSSRRLTIFRPTASAGHHATQLASSGSSAVQFTQAPSGRLNVMGLPASTTGLLLPGDFIEINGELKQMTSVLSSAADGTGTLAFRPGMFKQPAHADPVIIHNPMGSFQLTDSIGYESLFGSYADLTLTLDEVVV